MTVIYAVHHFFSFSLDGAPKHEYPSRNGAFLFNPHDDRVVENDREPGFRRQFFDIGVTLGIAATRQKLKIAVFQVFDRKNEQPTIRQGSAGGSKNPVQLADINKGIS